MDVLIELNLLYRCNDFNISKKGHGVAFIFVMLQMGFAFFGYGASKLPYILTPYIHIKHGVTNPSMAITLITAFIFALLLLIPSLILIMKLFVFDKEYVEGKNNSFN